MTTENIEEGTSGGSALTVGLGESDEDIDEFEDIWCTHCGGEGWCQVDDPLLDDCDEFGNGDCPACGGSGERRHQTVF